MRLTPAAASSATENDLPLIPTMKFTGFRHRRTHGAHGGEIGQAGSEKHIGADLLECLKTADSVVQARRRVEQIVRARRQHERKRQRACSLRGCCNPFDSQTLVVEWTIRIAGRILDRAAHESRLGGKPDRFGDDFRRVAEPSLEIGGDGQVGRIDNHARMVQRLRARQSAISSTKSARGSGARCRQRAEAKPGENSGGADVPWIRNDKRLWTVVKRAEACGLLVLTGAHDREQFFRR